MIDFSNNWCSQKNNDNDEDIVIQRSGIMDSLIKETNQPLMSFFLLYAFTGHGDEDDRDNVGGVDFSKRSL